MWQKKMEKSEKIERANINLSKVMNSTELVLIQFFINTLGKENFPKHTMSSTSRCHFRRS